MKKLLVFFTTLLCCYGGDTQDLTGTWSGDVSLMGRKITLLFHINTQHNISTGTLDVPAQGAKAIPVSSIQTANDSVRIEVAAINGYYTGRLTDKDHMKGILHQGSFADTVLLTRTNTIPSIEPSKPQTPKPPFDYAIEEVAYENTLQQVRLAGTFTKPNGEGKFPVVLMITGSGPQDHDESIGQHKPFWVIADDLTRHGIAVLRVDDRGTGKSTGNFATATSADFATDVIAGIHYLKSRKDVDTTKIGLLGHSEGALIAPYVAARDKSVAFIVMLAGPAVGGQETMYYQAVEKPMQQFSENNRNVYGSLYNKMLEIAIHPEVAKDYEGYVRTAYTEWKSKLPDSTKKALIHGTDEEVLTSFSSGFSMLKSPWFHFFLTYDMKKDLRQLKIPVLALNGEKDEQVDPKANLALIKDICNQNKNPACKVAEVPGVNHLFQHCTHCGSVPEYLALEETFDPVTLKTISNWVSEIVK